jgi:glycosyltransferase involved in cell wall biosynthesis
LGCWACRLKRKCLSSMRQLIECPERCREMGLAGRAKAEHEFQIPRMVEETLAVYRAAGWRET